MKRSRRPASKRTALRPRRSAGRKRRLASIPPTRRGDEAPVSIAAITLQDERPAQIPPPGLPPDAPVAEASTPDPVVAHPAVSRPTGGEARDVPEVAEPQQGRQSSRVEELLGFRLDDEEYCVWIRSIKEIIRPPEITTIPRSPADILGLISLRGTIVPIFNIRRRLGLPAGDLGPKARIVVVVLDAGPVGMVVDHVTEVVSVDPGALEPPPATMGEREAPLVTATVRLRERIIGVLHLERLLTIEDETPSRAAA